MHNRLYEYFMNNNIFHKNQFDSQTRISTDHVILQFYMIYYLKF